MEKQDGNTIENTFLMEKARVFIGIPAGEELLEDFVEFRKRHAGLPVRWIKPENLHFTVIPPWESENPAAVCELIAKVASAFQASRGVLTRVKTGPLSSKPGLIWATGQAAPFFGPLRDELYRALPVVRKEHRPYLLHLTIARVRRDVQHELACMKLDEPVAWNALFRKLSLYESVLKQSGAEYTVLCEAFLGKQTNKEL
ncbi:MAG: RNA 2',3'-cyclic phosphodiesterase [Chlorobiaceae bacterium]|nr:RNA 2',3'-cyclic phosphodiesterase [Chlorobiaceae bacterium]